MAQPWNGSRATVFRIKRPLGQIQPFVHCLSPIASTRQKYTAGPVEPQRELYSPSSADSADNPVLCPSPGREVASRRTAAASRQHEPAF
jgi:hypothetical protein